MSDRGRVGLLGLLPLWRRGCHEGQNCQHERKNQGRFITS